MNCQKCSSDRILEVSGKTSDLCWMRFKEQERDGYVATGLNIDDKTGDYLVFNLCIECGHIQGKWPVEDPEF